jgi:hypothetical protein
MNQQMQVELLGSSYVSVDGAEYASIFIGQQAEEGSANAKGIEVMKVSCDPDVFRSLPVNGYPLQVNLEMKLKKAAGGKLGQHCVKAIPARQVAKAS